MNKEELLDLLVCPVCQGKLSHEKDAAGSCQGLVCAACALVYPVRDGIPVMLPEEAVRLDKATSMAGQGK